MIPAADLEPEYYYDDLDYDSEDYYDEEYESEEDPDGIFDETEQELQYGQHRQPIIQQQQKPEPMQLQQ